MSSLNQSFKNNNQVCPASHSGVLDTRLRKLIHDPYKILKDYVKEGDTVIDIGCGPGFFSMPLANMVGSKGKVIAVDLQDEMLKKLKVKTNKANFQERFIYHNCTTDDIGISEKVDFVLTFWMVHEVQNPDQFFQQIVKTMKPESLYMLVEPKIHVTAIRYKEIINEASKAGLKHFKDIKVNFSRGSIFTL
jgi:ubiquinone/menaquinone biosynthesis C-methylase UbiE